MVITKELQKIIDKIKVDIQAYHNHLTDEYIDNMSLGHMLAYCHPVSRANFIGEIDRHNRAMERELKKELKDN
jgi:hypothetical protein